MITLDTLLSIIVRILSRWVTSIQTILRIRNKRSLGSYCIKMRDDTNVAPPPVYYINMDRDTERNACVRADLQSVFGGWTSVVRVRGMPDARGGMSGCRVAHTKAHRLALRHARHASDYYIVAEDDIRPLRCPETIRAYITIAMRANADMMMMEHAKGEVNADLQPIVDYTGRKLREFYRYRSRENGFGFACMLFRASFGQKLLRVWEKTKTKHCDLAAFELMPSHRVLFANPQLFAQRAYHSCQDDVGMRPNQEPFDFAAWQVHHGDRVTANEESVQ